MRTRYSLGIALAKPESQAISIAFRTDTRYVNGLISRLCAKCHRKKPIKGGRCIGSVPGTVFVCADCRKVGPE